MQLCMNVCVRQACVIIGTPAVVGLIICVFSLIKFFAKKERFLLAMDPKP